MHSQQNIKKEKKSRIIGSIVYCVHVIGHFRDYFTWQHSVENNMASGKTCVDPMSITGDWL